MKSQLSAYLNFLIIIFIICPAFSSTAQTFVQTSNTLNNQYVKSHRFSQPCLVDINHDGKTDLFSGEFNYKNNGLVTSAISFYKNTGTNASPVFTMMKDAENPLSNVHVAGLIIPRFVDIDGDGDEDCFIANSNGSITFMLNTGNAKEPLFEKQSAAFNPLSMVKSKGLEISSFVFADLDNDKDFDCIVSDDMGDVVFLKNTGSATKPAFRSTADNTNPFTFLRNTDIKNISFFDWNKDGFTDLFVNNIYYQSNGNKTNPAFIKNTLNAPIINADEMLSPNWTIVNDQTVIIAGNKNGSFDYLTAKTLATKASILIGAYPNPSTKSFVLDLSKSSGEKIIRLTDAKGNLINTYKTNNTSIVVGEDLQPGTYYIQILSNNEEAGSQKIIKM
jgi:hypothetical protein